MKYFWITLFFLGQTVLALAAEDYVTVRFIPGHVESGHGTEIRMDHAFGGDEIIAQVFEKMKEIPKSGLTDYVIPDAPSIQIEVSYKGELLKSGLTPDVGFPSDASLLPEKYEAFSRVWLGAYSIVENALQNSMDFPIGAHPTE